MSITALPPPPQRSDPSNFAARGDAFMAALPVFATEANALQTDVNAKQVTASAAATTATTQAGNAAASAAAAVSSTNVSIWVSGTTYAVGDNRFSPTNFQTYRRKTAGAGTTDPALDATNWTQISQGGLTLLATLTPTVSAAVNALTVFSSSYDSYMIIMDGITPATSAILRMRLAVAGSLDTSASYNVVPSSTIPASTAANTSSLDPFQGGVVHPSYSGASLVVTLTNMNSISGLKILNMAGAIQDNSSTFVPTVSTGFYSGASIVTGFGVLWGGGDDFQAKGTIRVYGVQKV